MALRGVDDSLKDATWSTWFCVLWTKTLRWLLLSCEIQQSSNKLCWLYSILIKHILVWWTSSSTPFLKISIFLTENQSHPFGRSKYPWDASRYSRCWPTACWRKVTFLPVFWKDFTLSIRENMRKQRNDAVLDAKIGNQAVKMIVPATCNEAFPSKETISSFHVRCKETTCTYLEPVCPMFLGFNPLKKGPFQSKQWTFGFQVYR